MCVWPLDLALTHTHTHTHTSEFPSSTVKVRLSSTLVSFLLSTTEMMKRYTSLAPAASGSPGSFGRCGGQSVTVAYSHAWLTDTQFYWRVFTCYFWHAHASLVTFPIIYEPCTPSWNFTATFVVFLSSALLGAKAATTSKARDFVFTHNCANFFMPLHIVAGLLFVEKWAADGLVYNVSQGILCH